MAKKVFVIYGRDEDAHRELSLFIRSLGLEELTFDQVAHSLGANPFIADVVNAGVRSADLVIALFTPDEQAALYSGEGHFLEQDPQAARWQARPNVIFEAGWAYGHDRNKTILATLGADVTLFSDVSGIHFIKLDTAQGKNKLRDRLLPIVKEIAPQPDNWEDPEISGNFGSVSRLRWKFYDELDSLERRLQKVTISRTGISLLWIVMSVASEAAVMQKPVGADGFMRLILSLFSPAMTDAAYWELIISGFLEFNDVGYDNEGGWGLGKGWRASAPYARVAHRGEMLLAKFAGTEDFIMRLEGAILERHKEINALIQQQKYIDAQALNSRILTTYPNSPRAHFNQARIYAQLATTQPAQTDQYLGWARRSLADALDKGIVKLLVLAGDTKERKSPLDVIRNTADLGPLFKRWPDLVPQVANADYLRKRVGGGGGCVGGMMAVELPGNARKPAWDLMPGDRVMAWNKKDAVKAEAQVVAVQRHISPDAWMINDKYCFTGVHPVLTGEGWTKTSSIKPGMALYLGSGATEAVTSIRRIRGNCPVVDIRVKPYSTFVAGGVVVHNKKL